MTGERGWNRFPAASINNFIAKSTALVSPFNSSGGDPTLASE